MRSVLVAFDAVSDAYAFVAEIRRRADTLLWDVRVRRTGDEAVVIVPVRVWRREPYVRTTAERYGGRIRDDDRAQDRQGSPAS